MNAVGRWNGVKPNDVPMWAKARDGERDGMEMKKKQRWSHSRRSSADSNEIVFLCNKTFNSFVKCSKHLNETHSHFCYNKNS